jgi:predicted nucleotidyltransferase
MRVTEYANVDELLGALLSEVRNILGEKLVGLYLYGSLAWGDFDHEVSDIDLLAATTTGIDDEEFAALKRMVRPVRVRWSWGRVWLSPTWLGSASAQ